MSGNMNNFLNGTGREATYSPYSTNMSGNVQSPSTLKENYNSQGVIDPDEQFVLDVIRTSKQESIQGLTDMLRLQESKSVLLIRILERYHQQLENKDMNK